jgi:nitric oxide reductase NorD protein
MSMSPANEPLTADQLEERLEALVYMVLNSRRSVDEPAGFLAGLPRASQDRFLASVALIGATSAELAYNFCTFAPPALELVGETDWHDWVLHIMDTYDQSGVLRCIVAMQRVKEHIEARRRSRQGVAFEEVSRVLASFVCGLSGRMLRLVAGDATYTDTETLYLPPRLDRFRGRDENYRLYKAVAVHLWAQAWFGTWRGSVAGIADAYHDRDQALRLLHALETLRLDACIARELPGVSREMQRLRGKEGAVRPSIHWQEAVRRLQDPAATVEHSAQFLEGLYAQGIEPPAVCYQGVLLPERTEQAMRVRQKREGEALRDALDLIAEEHAQAREGRDTEGEPEPFEALPIPDDDWPQGCRVELRLHGEPVTLSHDVQQLLASIAQDFGNIPAEYLEAAGAGRYREGPERDRESGAVVGDDQAHLYDEWDHGRQQYRKEWCLLKERDVHPVRDGFVARTVQKHRGLLKHLYRTFEALRGEDRMMRRQPFGEDIDLDAVVESYVDQRLGRESGERLFIKKRREDRNIAVMFMVDMSGSTKGWINDVEREALVLLCESLEILGDRYAIYGFSGFTHKRCELFRIKHFDEPYDDDVRARISGVKPQDYTRMGVAIRHLTRLLGEVEARTKLLITLSDGRPDDQDGYRGTYGIEDTRQALLEARYQGIHPYCITIDDEALEYLPHMYGPVSFTLINQVERLPFKVSDIYRRITM